MSVGLVVVMAAGFMFTATSTAPQQKACAGCGGSTTAYSSYDDDCAWYQNDCYNAMIASDNGCGCGYEEVEWANNQTACDRSGE